MPKPKITPAPETEKAPPKAASGVIPPTEEASAAPLRAELKIERPTYADIEDLAVQLSLASGEKRPYSYHIGRPMWQRFEETARNLLVFAAWKETKDAE